LIYNLTISSDEGRLFVQHFFIWRILDCRFSRWFGYINIPPYIQRPVQILDILENGKAIVLVYPETGQILTKGTPYRAAIGHGQSVKFLDCEIVGQIKLCNGFPLLKIRIEFLLFCTPVEDKECEIFLKHIPNLMENIPFSFFQETLEQHEKQLQGEPDKSSSDLQDEKSEDFALHNESESVGTEVVDS
jgi:hypothetical protein